MVAPFQHILDLELLCFWGLTAKPKKMEGPIVFKPLTPERRTTNQCFMGYPQPTHEKHQSPYQSFRHYRNKADLVGFSLFGMSHWQKLVLL